MSNGGILDAAIELMQPLRHHAFNTVITSLSGSADVSNLDQNT